MTFEVQQKACSTCIFRKDSPLDLKKLLDECADPNFPDFFIGHRICHHSETACCRGFWNRFKDKFSLGQIAQRLNVVTFVEHDNYGS